MAATGLTTAYFSFGSGAPSTAPGVATGEYALYQDTATGKMYVWGLNGTPAWAALGGGAMVLSQHIAPLGSAGASFDFASIPATGKHLRIVGQARGTTASTSVALQAQFNADTGSNYDSQNVQGFNTSAAGNAFLAQAFLNLGFITAASAVANEAGLFVIDIPNYLGTSFHKDVSYQTSCKDHAATDTIGNFYIYSGVGHWRNAAALTEIKLFPGSGNFDVGSTADLYIVN